MCVCVHVQHARACESIVAESDPRGPASYSLSAGDHNFHKTGIVGAGLQTPETHTHTHTWKQLLCTDTHTKKNHTHTIMQECTSRTNKNTHTSLHTYSSVVWELGSQQRRCSTGRDKVTGSLLKDSHLAAPTHTEPCARPRITAPHRNVGTNNSLWVVGQTIIIGASMLIMCD